MTAEPVLDAGLRQAIWPVHCRGRLWSYAVVRVPAGIALVPLEVGRARVAGAVGGFAVGIAVVAVALELGLDAGDGEDVLAVVFAAASSLLGRWLADRESTRRLHRILEEPVAASRRRGAFVVPAHAALATDLWRKGGRATFTWTEDGKPRKAALTIPADVLPQFRDILAEP